MIRLWGPWPHIQDHTGTLNFSNFDQKRLSALYLLNQITGSDQTSCIVTLEWFKDLVIFWRPWPNFEGHHTIKTVKKSNFDLKKLVCTLSPDANQTTDSSQTSYVVMLGWFKDLIRFWWHWPNFQGHHTILCDDCKKEPCLYSISWTNWWIFTKLAQKHLWNMGKKWLDFDDLDFIFKVTQVFWMSNFVKKKKKRKKKSLSAPYILNQMVDSGQTLCIVSLGLLKELIRYWWPWPNFYKGHHTIKTVKLSIVCTLFPEPIDGFWPNLHRNTNGTWERND